MKGKTVLAGAGVFLLVFGGVLAALQVDRWFRVKDQGPSIILNEAPIVPVQAPAVRPGFDFSAAARKVIPSVVSVDNLVAGRTFFGESVVQKRSSGSGVIISRDGYILTNAHVVDGATQVRVRLADKRSLNARLIGEDPRSDLALLKVEATGLTPATYGDARVLRPGEWVMAVGSPLGYDSTVSVGVVSSLGRSLPTESTLLVDTIQTDAAINQGNSGGALTNAQGDLVGINTAIASPTGGSVGIGFAIPIDHARRVVQDLIKYGRARYGILGVSLDQRDNILQVPRARQELMELTGSASEPPSSGLLITRVTQGGPAARAGIQRLDVIMEVDGRPIQTSADYQRIVISKKPGDSLRVKVWGRGTVRTLTLTLADSA
jgi:serine protease Do